MKEMVKGVSFEGLVNTGDCMLIGILLVKVMRSLGASPAPIDPPA